MITFVVSESPKLGNIEVYISVNLEDINDNLVASYEGPQIANETEIRFNPAMGRYLKITKDFTPNAGDANVLSICDV